MSSKKDIFGEIIWPEEVLIKARKAVCAYGYAVGGEAGIMRGEHDDWHAIQIACYAISGQEPMVITNPEARKEIEKSFQQRIQETEKEIKQRLGSLESKIARFL